MKVRIKKQGKKKEFNLINSWSDVTLKTWLELAKFDGLSKSEEAEETIAALSDIPKKLIKELSIQDVAVILGKIAELQQEENTSLKKIVEIEGKKYGWHPDLSSITLGEYADIESLLKNGVENNLPQVMAILYRPIIAEGENDTYTIEAYDGNIDIRAEEMKKMSAEQVQNALRFFFALGKILSLTLELYLMEAHEGNEDAIATESFADKWSWFGVMYRLTGGEIVNLKAITELNLFEALTWLTYETDLESQNRVKHGSKQ